MTDNKPQARWYCIDRNGMATLCKDEDDATWEASDNDKVFPRNGPHRAVQLVELATQAPKVTSTGDSTEGAGDFAQAHAEFELHCNGEFAASASGPRARASDEIRRYAAQYAQDGPIEIFEVTRTKVAPQAKAQEGP